MLGYAAKKIRSWKKEYVRKEFNRMYYDGEGGKNLYHTLSWMGVPIQKCPEDLFIYQEILFKTRPDLIVETGVFNGGSTLYLASLCDLLGHGEIVACDITLSNLKDDAKKHPRTTFFEGSSTAPEIVQEIEKRARGKRTMVILDSDHSEKHVAQELKLYAPLVSSGCYLICEDTNVNGNPVNLAHGPGPYEAVTKFVQSHPGWAVDESCERLMLTFNPSGYLYKQ